MPAVVGREQSLLEASLVAHGCLDPLVLWIDPTSGQRSLSTVTHDDASASNGIDALAVSLDLPDRNAVINWIIANQLGRRNLSDEQKTYLRGKRFIAEKKAVGKPAQRTKKILAHDEPISSTAKKLAKENNVAPATIKRDADYAAGVDQIEKEEGPEARRKSWPANQSARKGSHRQGQAAVAHRPSRASTRGFHRGRLLD